MEKLFKIEWVDSHGGCEDWIHREDLKPLGVVTCVSVGFVIDETEDCITLSHTVSDNQILGRLSIPKVAIKKQRRLK
jgi:hypothetical protein